MLAATAHMRYRKAEIYKLAMAVEGEIHKLAIAFEGEISRLTIAFENQNPQNCHGL